MTVPDDAVPVEQLSFTEASRELDAIVNFFEQREGRCGRARGPARAGDRADRRARPAPASDPGPGRRAGARLDALAGNAVGATGEGAPMVDGPMGRSATAPMTASTFASCCRVAILPGAT